MGAGREGRLGGKVAIVTGAASGIGRVSAERFAAEGARVVVADIDADGAEGVAAGIVKGGGEATHVRCDVSRADDARAMVEAAVERYGGLDVLFNNAGYTNPPRPFGETTEEELDRSLAVNVKGVFLCSQAAIPAMRGRGGSIIVTASVMGMRTRPGFTAYASSKAAAIHLARTLAVELAGENIRVNCLAPVATDTPMLNTFIGDRDPEEGRAAFISTIPLGRLATPSDVASAALYLASDEAAYITGTVLPVDGGRSI
ncbi:glucose 1-dehydrogenase [Rubrobacter marinus]|uniref:Glucose 1-dehydrogenase n=1 Tax=Rubrobacter marinus TaxID=2653852 RepID=A0A6G8PWJ5_9ACTN|nr:SDR family oxidoreductase [Rubrobacter marinus]QIN78517.1 glucose 1-dehydrogenase [Rubrobacter marinus]